MRGGVRTFDYERILTLYDAGNSLQAIATEIGCSTATVSMVAKRHGRSPLHRRYPSIPALDVDQMLQDYQQGMPLAELFEKHQISYNTFAARLSEHGLERRPRPKLAGAQNGQYKHGKGSRRRERDYALTKQVVALCFGHVVPLGWQIHHIDENPANNRPENLAVFLRKGDHATYHQQLLRLQREGHEADASQLVLENGGMLLPLPLRPILLPHERDRLDPQ